MTIWVFFIDIILQKTMFHYYRCFTPLFSLSINKFENSLAFLITSFRSLAEKLDLLFRCVFMIPSVCMTPVTNYMFVI